MMEVIPHVIWGGVLSYLLHRGEQLLRDRYAPLSDERADALMASHVAVVNQVAAMDSKLQAVSAAVNFGNIKR